LSKDVPAMSRLLPLVLLVLAGMGVGSCAGGTTQPGQSFVAGAGCAPVSLLGPDSRAIDLSGAWSGNDGGRYFIKQIDSCVWWSGLSAFPGQALGDEWIMAFRGTLDSSGRISGDFVDVKGTNPGAGTMTIRVESEVRDGQVVVELHRESATGHQIGVTFWQRYAGGDAPPPSSPSGAPSMTLPPG
jgi:hypothetical protein